MNGDGTWPPTDGRGCPVCGAMGDGGHGGGCPNKEMSGKEKITTIKRIIAMLERYPQVEE